MVKQRGFRWWARRGGGLSLVVFTVLVAARIGMLPDAGYRVLYWLVAAPGRALGKGESTALLYFKVGCQPYRYPREVAALITLGERRPGVERTIFACRGEE